MNIAEVFNAVRDKPLSEDEALRVRAVILAGPLQGRAIDARLLSFGLIQPWRHQEGMVEAGPHAKHFHGPDGMIAPIFVPVAWRERRRRA